MFLRPSLWPVNRGCGSCRAGCLRDVVGVLSPAAVPADAVPNPRQHLVVHKRAEQHVVGYTNTPGSPFQPVYSPG